MNEVLVYASHTETSTLQVEFPYFYKDQSADCTVCGRIDAEHHIRVIFGNYGPTEYIEFNIEPTQQPFPKETFDAELRSDAQTFDAAMSRTVNAINVFRT